MEGILNKIINSKSKTFLAFCFCFLLGILVISVIDIRFDFIYFYLSLFVILSFFILFWRNAKIRFVLLCFCVFLLGIGRYLLVFPSGEIKASEAEFIGLVASEPDVRQDSVRYIIEARNHASVRGKIYLKSNLYPRYRYGDILKIRCDLSKPDKLENGFRYDMYLARMGVFAVCWNAEVEKSGNKGGNAIYQLILQMKEKVAQRINNLWHEPYAGFMAGLLYGYRGGLGDLTEVFNRTGVTHIIAISGYNISIIVSVLISFCIHLRVPRKKAFYLIAFVIFIFVIFAGLSPPVIRAGIMGVLVLLATQIGRLSRIANAIMLTVVLMCLQNPFVLVWDAGFQLSFAAVLGLIYLKPLFDKYFMGMPELYGIKDAFLTTLSAIIATLPLILYQFGRLSVVALAANVLILWLIPYLMLFGFLAVVFSFIFFPIGQTIAWIGGVGLGYVVVVVRWFAGLKFATIDFQIPWWAMAGAYVIMIYFMINKQMYAKKN